jgi:Ni/Fe-hydrogenase subunit HybB-like protein
MTRGPFARAFWGGAVTLGGIVPLLLLLAGPLLFVPANRVVAGLASVLALAGLLIFEWCFVMAGQSVPNS